MSWKRPGCEICRNVERMNLWSRRKSRRASSHSRVAWSTICPVARLWDGRNNYNNDFVPPLWWLISKTTDTLNKTSPTLKCRPVLQLLCSPSQSIWFAAPVITITETEQVLSVFFWTFAETTFPSLLVTPPIIFFGSTMMPVTLLFTFSLFTSCRIISRVMVE